MTRSPTTTVVSSHLENGQAIPRSKPSFLRRKSKERSAAAAAAAAATVDTYTPHASRNYSTQSLQYPSVSEYRHYKPRSHQHESFLPRGDDVRPLKNSTETPVAFPTLDRVSSSQHSTSKTDRTYVDSSPWSRKDSYASQPRFSGSSFQSRTESPPGTPVSDSSSNSSLDIHPSLVAAPVAGVEFMDALVDGMNGIGDDGYQSSSLSRSQFSIPGHHPLYQPPLPTPPPGVVLGRAKGRISLSPDSSEDEIEDGDAYIKTSARRSRRRRTGRPNRLDDTELEVIPSDRHSYSPRTSSPQPSLPSRPLTSPNLSSSSSRSPVTPRGIQVSVTPPPPSTLPSTSSSKPSTAVQPIPKVVLPSISDIIRTHAPRSGQVRSRPTPTSSHSLSPRASTFPRPTYLALYEEESESERLDPKQEPELLSRSSIDSITDEIQRSLRVHMELTPQAHLNAPAPDGRRSMGSDTFSTRSPPSETAAEPSVYSCSAASTRQPPSVPDVTFWTTTPMTQSQAIAQYLRSARLTTLLSLTRAPHASLGNPLTVSLSDLGDRSGFPVIVFLGLGCVRHVMGLYDEMAECLGIRLITIDRWGLGRTDARPKSAKGIVEWAAVVEEVLDLLHIDQCSVMAHSAGAPYALSFANKIQHRIRGGVCLLAPWVGGGEGGAYKWLKYVPSGILKTAQAAEWKIQAWMIGKPPRLAYEGIGHIAAPSPPSDEATLARCKSPVRSNTDLLDVSVNSIDKRPSIGSFSEYDDLGDFDGRFGSHSTLGALSQANRSKSKLPKKFLRRKNTSPSADLVPDDKSGFGAARKLKALRSMGSLRSKAAASAPPRKSESSVPQLPLPLNIECDLGLSEVGLSRPSPTPAYTKFARSPDYYATLPKLTGSAERATGRRSISFSAPPTSPRSLSSARSSPSPSSPVPSVFAPPFVPGTRYQADLGNALIAASHAESAKGMHNDLLQILNRENHAWGFSYATYPHTIRVWYGDRDEKIAENGIRWMERTMGADRCRVEVVKGADHGLMYRSGVVVEVLEHFREYWRDEN